MTTVETADVDVADDHAHDHPSDWAYIKIAVILGVLTATEVFTYFESVHSLPDGVIIAGLVILMIVKFALVVGYFMHLKFDSIWFTRLFVAGIILALGVYLVMLTAFEFWS